VFWVAIVAALEEVDGLWTTSRILMHAGGGRSSSLTLQGTS